MKRKFRALEIFSLSFLDVVSCGFGAIVLLFVIMKISDPQLNQITTVDLTEPLARLSEENEQLQIQSDHLQQNLELRKSELTQLQPVIADLETQYRELTNERQEIQVQQATHESIIKQLESARQDLTEEVRRLQESTKPRKTFDSLIGGIPVDSEYIIFVIDTSGSMQQFAWPTVRKKMAEILSIYPQVKGIQVVNDMGDYMFPQYSNRWIRDSPARRKAILQQLSGWMPFSNSSPVEGVTAVVKRFHAPDKKISIYILGDDFSRGSIQDVIDTIARINSQTRDSSKRVRIHAIGFPVLFGQPGAELNVARFSALMRKLAEDNDGSFVGLTNLR